MCTRCEEREIDCLYDVAEGPTREQHFKNQLAAKTHEYDNVMIFVNALRYGSDQQASTLLAKLRLGDDVEE